LSCGTACKLPLAVGLQFVLFASAAAADVELDVVSGLVQLVVWHGSHAAACVPGVIGS